ncbi:conserved oligomeric Golgi complex subunit 2-like isoform X2 [Mustela putorius furo]|uniref:Conserved oligomeric Golgi complex subunit 2-like isoform X2 n=1 Tax=Mustela putorius furo TaxID=9669 RepID=A0A8U0RVG8_MUSPF|nr:conserved oligomeric Golgi complex subunit 2-like isoform X2 [Mustela putorius furo]
MSTFGPWGAGLPVFFPSLLLLLYSSDRNTSVSSVSTILSLCSTVLDKQTLCAFLLRITLEDFFLQKSSSELWSQESQSSVSARPLWTREILERIATEFNQLQFHAVQSKGMPLLDKVRPRIAHIMAMLQQSLGGLLLEGLQTSNVDIIRHCLQTYATIDKTRDAEALVGQVVVKPYMDEVIVEQIVESHPDGLKIMYANKLLEFVPHHCRLLREVTGGAISSPQLSHLPRALQPS